MSDNVVALRPLADRAGGLRPEPRAASQPKALIPSADTRSAIYEALIWRAFK